jgi:maleylacetate reductase
MSSYAVERGFDHPIPTPADFIHDSLPGRVVFGAGASEQCLLPELDRLRLRSMLTVASRSQVGVAARIEARLGPRSGGRFPLTDRSTRSELVAATVQAARTANADGLLVVGGGTAIGVAKSAAARAGLSIIALPTTYSGAELSPTYQADGDTRRSSPDALPGAIIYDPRLTFSLSDRLTSSSAMSALANGVEALCCLHSSPVSALIAQEGIRHIAEGARDSVLHREGLVGRSITQFGGYLTGAAAAVTRPGVLQTVCEELARVASVRYADARAVILPHYLAVLRQAQPLVLASIAAALTSNDAVHGLNGLAADIGAPRSLAELGVTPDDLRTVTEVCAERSWGRPGLAEQAMPDVLAAALHHS